MECERLSWGSLFLDYPQSLGDEHSFSALISITVNASLVIVSAQLLLRTTAVVLISPLHIKIYPPSLWDNGYIWWAGVDSDHRSQVTTDLQSVPFGRSGTYPYMWSWRLESNPQPADYKSAALPIELHQQFF